MNVNKDIKSLQTLKPGSCFILDGHINFVFCLTFGPEGEITFDNFMEKEIPEITEHTIIHSMDSDEDYEYKEYKAKELIGTITLVPDTEVNKEDKLDFFKFVINMYKNYVDASARMIEFYNNKIKRNVKEHEEALNNLEKVAELICDML